MSIRKNSIVYSEGYKYQLGEDFVYELPAGISLKWSMIGIDEPFYEVQDHNLTVKHGYAWDGPSGPSIDTPNWMRASLVHDVLYQAISEGNLSMHDRKIADKIMYMICRQDGMSVLRALLSYWAVRLFGKAAAKEKIKRIVAP